MPEATVYTIGRAVSADQEQAVDDELNQLLTLVDHESDTASAERWFTVIEQSLEGGDAQSENWDTFVEQLRERAEEYFDSSTVDAFVSGADQRLADPFAVVRRFVAEIGPARAVEAYGAARAEMSPESTSLAGPDWQRFSAFLIRNDHQWQQTWPQSREWLAYTARHEEGFGSEVDSFEAYADQGTELTQLLELHGATASRDVGSGADGVQVTITEVRAMDHELIRGSDEFAEIPEAVRSQILQKLFGEMQPVSDSSDVKGS